MENDEMSEDNKTHFKILMLLSFFVMPLMSYISGSNMYSLINDNIITEYKFGQPWITVGELHYQDTSPLGYELTSWGLFFVTLILSVILVYFLRKYINNIKIYMIILISVFSFLYGYIM